ncbi:MAG: cyclodeaminase/cyclohydrolase family protein [Candidatus Omnitrophota bacterium]|nr:cyclodeaminase/cyclohydrolase family protein [Candidatus Omnitrophota bacterium]
MGASSVRQLLEQTADRRSSYGGGSAAALSCALAAALVEKLAGRTGSAIIARRLRACCTRLIEADAQAFARVVRAGARQDHRAIRRALTVATGIPSQVGECAQQVLSIARRIRARVSPRYRVDLRCAEALARTAKQSAQALVAANRAWRRQRS